MTPQTLIRNTRKYLKVTLTKEQAINILKSPRVVNILVAFSNTLGYYGVEGFRYEFKERRYEFLYVNRGDTYQATLCYDGRTDRLSFESWGDFVESIERRGGHVE